MSWQCPDCGRQFRNKNQSHSCINVDVADHFRNRPEKLRWVYDTLIKSITTFGDVKVEPVKNAIMAKANSTFLAIKPKKDHLVLEFMLDREVLEFPVYKTFRYTKNKTVHYVLVEEEDEVDAQLLSWLRESYQLSLK